MGHHFAKFYLEVLRGIGRYFLGHHLAKFYLEALRGIGRYFPDPKSSPDTVGANRSHIINVEVLLEVIESLAEKGDTKRRAEER